MRITLSEAATVGYASRPTIYRKISAGELQLHTDGNKKVVDVADLIRVFGEPGERNVVVSADAKALATQAENDQLKQELLQAKAALADKEKALVDARVSAEKERDRLLTQIEEGTKRLSDMREDKVREADRTDDLKKAIETLEKTVSERKGLFSRLFG